MRKWLWQWMVGGLAFFLLLNSTWGAEGEAWAELEAELFEQLSSAGIPGGAVVIHDRSGEIRKVEFGWMPGGSERPFTSTELVPVGSVSKIFTGLLVAKAVESDLVSWRLPVMDALRRGFEPIRLHHLLEHTAGIEGSRHRDFASAIGARSRLEDLEIRYPSGRVFSYSNHGPQIAAATVEGEGEAPWEELSQRWIFEPLGLEDLAWGHLQGPQGASLRRDLDSETAGLIERFPYPAAGTLLASVEAIAEVMHLFSTGELAGRLGVPWSELKNLHVPMESEARSGGLGMGLYGRGLFGYFGEKGSVFIGHGGSIGVYRTWAAYLPDGGGSFCVVIGANRADLLYRIKASVEEYLENGYGKAEIPVSAPLEECFTARGWYEPVGHDLVLRDWIWRWLGTVRLERAVDGLVWKSWLNRAVGTPWHHAGAGRFRVGTLPQPTQVVVEIEGGEQWFVGWETYRPISWWVVFGRGVFILAACLAGIQLLYVGLRWLYQTTRGSKGTRKVLPICWILSLLSFYALLYLYAKWGIFAEHFELVELGKLSWRSLSLLGLSLVGPTGWLGGFFEKRLGRLGKSKSSDCEWSLADRSIFSLLAILWGSLILVGWVPLLTFA